MALAFCLVSLTGLPPTAGFVAKVYIFNAAVQSDLVWLVIVGVHSPEFRFEPVDFPGQFGGLARGGAVSLAIFDDRVEVWSMGKFPNGITPETIRKGIPSALRAISEADYVTVSVPEEAGAAEARERYVPADEIPALVRSLSKEMRKAAQNMDFERAAVLRDRIRELRGQELALGVRE